ncbi:MAG TPA: 50S ribosomal protein L11 methyltransferase [Nitrospiria bacterium]
MKVRCRSWRKITVTLPRELEEAASARLIELGAAGVWVEEIRLLIRLSVFFPNHALGKLEEIRGHLTRLAPDGPVHIETAQVQEQKWQTSWQSRSVPTQRIGKRLIIIPPWNRRGVKSSGRRIIYISPGMAFGTGTHATTRSCLTLLEHAFGARPIASLLDIGTGSGILAIAAAKLGARRVIAVEIDPDALSAAKRNVKLNRVENRITLRKSMPHRRTFPCVVANLTGPILIELSSAIKKTVRSGGRLILSGLMNSEEEDVLRAYRGSFTILKRKRPREWSAFLLEKQG